MDRLEIIGQGKFLQLLRRNRWEYVERRNVKAIVAIVGVYQGQALLVEQMRPPIGARCIEWPAGLVGDVLGQEDETMENAALRELEEETGFTASRLELLTYGPASAGQSNEILHFYYAHDLRKVATGGGVDGEKITTHLVPLGEVEQWLKRRQSEGIMVDLKVFTGLYFLNHHTDVNG